MSCFPRDMKWCPPTRWRHYLNSFFNLITTITSVKTIIINKMRHWKGSRLRRSSSTAFSRTCSPAMTRWATTGLVTTVSPVIVTMISAWHPMCQSPRTRDSWVYSDRLSYLNGPNINQTITWLPWFLINLYPQQHHNATHICQLTRWSQWTSLMATPTTWIWTVWSTVRSTNMQINFSQIIMILHLQCPQYQTLHPPPLLHCHHHHHQCLQILQSCYPV